MRLEQLVRGIIITPAIVLMLARSVFPGFVYEQKKTAHGDTTIVWETQEVQGGTKYINQGTGESYIVHNNGVIDNIHDKNGKLTNKTGHERSLVGMRRQNFSDGTSSFGVIYRKDMQGDPIVGGKLNTDKSAELEQKIIRSAEQLAGKHLFEKGDSLYSKKDYKGALNYFERAVKADNTKSKYFNGLGDALYKLNQLDGSLLYYNKSLTIDDKNGSTWWRIGNVWLKKGDKTKAKDFYKKGMDLGDNNSKLNYEWIIRR